MSLELREFTLADESSARAAHEQLIAEGFDFLGAAAVLTRDWSGVVDCYRDWAAGVNPPPGYGPCLTLAAVAHGEFAGRTSIRLGLNDFLATRGGHIGYAVIPQHRRRGYATEILRQSLDIIRGRGVQQVLVTCDDANTGSASVIQRNGGVLESVVDDPVEGRYRRYWFN